jgi:hypothetical protein
LRFLFLLSVLVEDMALRKKNSWSCETGLGLARPFDGRPVSRFAVFDAFLSELVFVLF